MSTDVAVPSLMKGGGGNEEPTKAMNTHEQPTKCNLPSVALGKRMRVPGKIHKGLPVRKASPITTVSSFPGPGSYSVSTKYTTPSPPAFSFGIPLSRPSLDMASTPGPGSYCIKSKPLGPSFSITGREHGFKYKDNPGPGTYDHGRKVAVAEGPAFSLGARIKSMRSSECPGPGSYPLKTKSCGPFFSMPGRISPCRSDGVPGPGAYSQPSRASSPAFSLYGKAHDPKMPVDVPGPGAYTLPSTREGPFFSLLRRISPLPEGHGTPGPGNYPAPSGRSESPAFSFGSRLGSNSSSRDNSPGPGEYNTRMSPATPSFSFGTKSPLQKPHLGPGPGSYEANTRPSGPQHSLHSRVPCVSSGAAGLPGPGAYNPRYMRYRPAFSIKGRIEVPVKVETPGPGAYRPVMDLVVAAAPRFSLGGRVEGLQRQEEEKPGQGSREQQEGPAFSSILRRIPGGASAAGGAYNPVCWHPLQAVSLGRRVELGVRSDGPTYRLAYKASGPSFCTGKPAVFTNPGPSNDDRLHAHGKNGPAFSLLSKTVKQQREASPGPGSYHPRLPPHGPSFTMYGRTSLRC